MAAEGAAFPLPLSVQVSITTEGELHNLTAMATVTLLVGTTEAGTLPVMYVMDGETPQEIAERTLAERVRELLEG